MALVLNGSGITSENIADNAITSTKIADGTIVNADVADVAASKLTGALPAIDGSALTGISGGKILQVQNTTSTGNYSNSSTTYQNAFSVNITPSSASSQILVFASVDVSHYDNTDSSDQAEYAIFRDSSSILDRVSSHYDYGGGGSSVRRTFGLTILDSPATTSAVNYSVRFRNGNAVNSYINDSYGKSTITVMEIGA